MPLHRGYHAGMRARHIITGLAVVALGATAATAHAEALTISLDRVVFGSPGDVTQLVTRPIDVSMVGFVCTADYRGQNNGSVHPGTDLLVASGGSQLVLAGIEDRAGGTTTGTGQLVLGTDIVVSVRLGGDGVASMGASLSLTCSAPATTTSTTTAPAVSTTAPPTSSPTTTLAAEPGSETTVAAAGEPTTTTSTTVVVAAAGPTVAPADAVPTPTTPSSATPSNPGLPATGSSSDQLTSVALAALLAGTLLCLSRRREAPVAGR